MIFAVFDPSPLTVCINCSFFTFIFAVLLPGVSRLLIMSLVLDCLIFQDVCRRHLGFWKFPIFNSRAVKRVELHHLAKFCQNRPNCGWDMAIFRFFNGGRRHLGLLIFRIFNSRDGQDVRSALPCQMWWKSVGPRLRYGDFSIFHFKMAAAAILDFENFKF